MNGAHITPPPHTQYQLKKKQFIDTLVLVKRVLFTHKKSLNGQNVFGLYLIENLLLSSILGHERDLLSKDRIFIAVIF